MIAPPVKSQSKHTYPRSVPSFFLSSTWGYVIPPTINYEVCNAVCQPCLHHQSFIVSRLLHVCATITQFQFDLNLNHSQYGMNSCHMYVHHGICSANGSTFLSYDVTFSFLISHFSFHILFLAPIHVLAPQKYLSVDKGCDIYLLTTTDISH